MATRWVAIAVGLALAGTARGGATAFEGAQIHTASGGVFEGGVLLVEDGRIVDVGPRELVEVPTDATRVDLSGKVLVPGLVDTHSHLGATGDLNEGSGPLQPGLSAIDAIDPTSATLWRARAGGITTVNVMPGSGNLVGGQTAYLKLRVAQTVDDMLLCEDRRTDVCGGLKMANGTNSRKGQGNYPHTRMASVASVREMFLGAQKFAAELNEPAKDGKRSKGEKAGGGEAAVPLKKRDYAKEALVQVLNGDRIVHFHTHRADDVVTALSVAREFGFDVVLHHVSEAWKVVDAITEAAAPVSLIVIDSPGGKEEATELRAENAALLEQAGAMVSLHTDDPITDSRLFLRSGAMAVRAGMTREGALAALTLSGARQLGLADRVGSLEPGKDADFVVLSGDPFSVWTRVDQTWIEGELVFDRSNPEHEAHAVGGYPAYARTAGGPR